jgi:predicted nucleic acid-binding protein
MIVVDSNVLAYLYLENAKYGAAARELRETDDDWVAPKLWRSEFRNILTKYFKHGSLTLSQGLRLQQDAESYMTDGEYEVSSEQVLRLAQESGCTAYDCEFVALAKHLDVKLVTTDKDLLKAFPRIAVPLL